MIDLLLKCKTKYLKHRIKRIKQWKKYEDIQTMSLIFDYEDYEAVLPQLKQFEREGKTVRAWTYSEKYEWNENDPENVVVINDKHMNFWYLPLPYVMEDFKGYPNDWMLDLSHTTNPVTDYLVVNSPALFRAGFKTNDPSVYDFILDISHEPHTIEENMKTLLFYLKSLRIK